ncbi:MAG: hypothetical protein LBN20_00015 [Endomicrobium sp.]|nr:hypothetical protein [Endomicrobium sp.]
MNYDFTIKLERSLEIAKKMKSQGLSDEQINQWTGLSIEEIKKAKNYN